VIKANHSFQKRQIIPVRCRALDGVNTRYLIVVVDLCFGLADVVLAETVDVAAVVVDVLAVAGRGVLPW
jgi:hypothetical protein